VDRPDPQAEIPADAVAWAPLIFLDEGRAATVAAAAANDGAVPDLIVYDATVGHAARALAREWNVPAAQLLITFASNEHFSPISLVRRFGDHPALAAYRGAVAEMLSAHGLDHLDVPDFAGATEDLSIVLLSREFQIANETFDDRFVFVGAALGDAAVGRPGGGARWEPPGGGPPILFVTLGCLHDRRPELLRECVAAFTGVPWHVVIVVEGRADPAVLRELPSNVEVHRQVSRSDVLPHASVFLSYAGMCSAMEAQYFGVPMVAVPQTPQQATVAERIAELRLGRCLAPADLTVERLRDTVLEVGTDPRIRAAVDAMRVRLHRAGGTRAAADALLAHLGARDMSTF
jgi:dTDP-L-oleandrosyltransferase